MLLAAAACDSESCRLVPQSRDFSARRHAISLECVPFSRLNDRQPTEQNRHGERRANSDPEHWQNCPARSMNVADVNPQLERRDERSCRLVVGPRIHVTPPAARRAIILRSRQTAGFSQRPSQRNSICAFRLRRSASAPRTASQRRVGLDQNALRHGPSRLLIQRAAFDRLRVAVAAQHDERVADHRRLALFVEAGRLSWRSTSRAPSHACRRRLRRSLPPRPDRVAC